MTEFPLTAAHVTFAGHQGEEIEGYAARVAADAPRGGVVFIHHLPGWDRQTKEYVRRAAAMGFNAVAPHLYSREGRGLDPDDAAAAARAHGGVSDEQVVGDVAGAVAYLKGLANSNGKVGVIGHCSGGRHSFLVATSLDVDAAVDCYGGMVVEDPPPGLPTSMRPIADRVPSLSCPLLGLFGNDDQHPAPEHVDALEQMLKSAGKDYEFHRYDGAGHAFFAVDRPSYRVEAAVDGWGHIERFFDTYLGR